MRLIQLALLLGICGCISGCLTLAIDPSINAAEAGDLTVQLVACHSVTPDGFQACRLREGEPIASGFYASVEKPGGAILGGEITILYKDLAPITIGITDSTTFIPFVSILGPGLWNRKDHDGTIVLLVKIRYKSDDGVEHLTKGLGEVRVLVLDPKYDGVLPVNSGFVAVKNKLDCTIVYSTAFRSGNECL